MEHRRLNRIALFWISLGLPLSALLQTSETLGEPGIWLVAMPALCLCWINAAPLCRALGEVLSTVLRVPRRHGGARYVR